MKLHRNQSNAVVKSGDELISFFQSVLANQLAVLTAEQTASRTEQEALAAIQTYSTPGRAMVSPDDIPQQQANNLARESMEAHLQKVQSAQLSDAAIRQNAELLDRANSLYKGKKVEVSVIELSAQPIEAVFVDKTTGQERVSVHRGNGIKGTIDSVLLDKNLLVLRPSLSSQLITPNRQFYIVHVLILDGLVPAVSLSIR